MLFYWLLATGYFCLETNDARGVSLIVSLASMPHGYDFNQTTCIIHTVNHTIVSDTDSPAILRADKFTATRRARLISQ